MTVDKGGATKGCNLRNAGTDRMPTWGAFRRTPFHSIANGRNRCTMVAAFELQKKIVLKDSRRIHMNSQRLLGLSRITAACLLLIFVSLTPSPLAAKDDRSRSKNFEHVFIIMMENTGFNALMGNPNAPFINAAAAKYGLANNYYGVTHPSQPNYIAATSGSTHGVADDNDTTIDVPNIVDQLEANGKSWKGYMQSYSLCTTPLDHACGNQLYERKHNPFISYKDVQSNPARVAKIVDFIQLATDLASNDVPD